MALCACALVLAAAHCPLSTAPKALAGPGGDFEKGRYLEDVLGDLTRAIGHYRAAFRSSPDAPLKALALYRLGRCHEKNADLARARRAYADLLGLEGVEDDLRQKARQRISHIRILEHARGHTARSEALSAEVAALEEVLGRIEGSLSEVKSSLREKDRLIEDLRRGRSPPSIPPASMPPAHLFDRIISEKETSRRVKTYLSGHFFQIGLKFYRRLEYARALEEFKKAVILDPTNRDAAVYVQRVRYILGEIQGPPGEIFGGERISRAEEARLSIETALQAGKRAFEEGDYRAALDHFEGVMDIVRWSPWDVPAGSLKEVLSAVVKGIEECHRKLAPREAGALRKLREQKEDLSERLRRSSRDLFTAGSALEERDREILELTGSTDVPRRRKAMELLREAGKLAESGDDAAAREKLMEALGLDPTLTEASRLLGCRGGVPPPALRDRMREEAAHAFEDGLRAYDEGSYRLARNRFERVLRLAAAVGAGSPRPTRALGHELSRARKLLEELHRRLLAERPGVSVEVMPVAGLVGREKAFGDDDALASFLKDWCRPGSYALPGRSLSVRRGTLIAFNSPGVLGELRGLVSMLARSGSFEAEVRLVVIAAADKFLKNAPRDFTSAPGGVLVASFAPGEAAKFLSRVRTDRSAHILHEVSVTIPGGRARPFEVGRWEEYISGYETKRVSSSDVVRPVLGRAFRGVRGKIRMLVNDRRAPVASWEVEVCHLKEEFAAVRTPHGNVQVPVASSHGARFLTPVPPSGGCLVVAFANPLTRRSVSLYQADEKLPYLAFFLTASVKEEAPAAPGKK